MRPARTSIPILTYHSIDPGGSVLSIAPDNFRWQMAHLRKRGYRSMTLSQAADLAARGEPFPEKTFVATFDDAYRNVYEHAYPVLQAGGFTATLFVIADYCGKDNGWPSQPKNVARLPLMTWDEVRGMASTGFEMGAHTCTHPDLRTIPLSGAEDEILGSQNRIHERTGRRPVTFAYPYGGENEALRAIIRRQFTAGVTTRMGLAHGGGDCAALDRIDMFYLRDPRVFARIGTRGFPLFLAFRQWLRDIKARFK